MRIGIGITTRNRPDIMRVSSEHHLAFRPADSKFAIVNDQSEVAYDDVYARNLGCDYIVPPERLGIAKAKNECLKALSDCDWVFLFDDDTFPCKDGWADAYISACERNKVGHLMHLDTVGIVTVKNQLPGGLVTYYQSLGCMLMFSRNALNILGGFDKRFNYYGYEHAQMSRRAHAAKLSPDTYTTIAGSGDYIYAMDVRYHSGGKLPIGELREPFGEKLSCNDKKQAGEGSNTRAYDDNTIWQGI